MYPLSNREGQPSGSYLPTPFVATKRNWYSPWSRWVSVSPALSNRVSQRARVHRCEGVVLVAATGQFVVQ